jgi:hypothetical protein
MVAEDASLCLKSLDSCGLLLMFESGRGTMHRSKGRFGSNKGVQLMHRTASLVLTTINDSEVLDTYWNNFKTYGHAHQISVFAIPDRKTPTSFFEKCARLAERGMKVECPSLEAQESYLERLGIPHSMIPWNSDNRRNVGYLMAYEANTDFILSIDDDNYCMPDRDYFVEHSVVHDEFTHGEIAQSDTGWYNICDLLELDRSGRTYARGFPYYARHRSEKITRAREKSKVRINAGLWLGDPDVDGITWLVSPARSVRMIGESVILSMDTWSPVNSQNTSLHRDALPAYYFVRMGYPLAGMPIDRYGDIFSGYFLQACARHLGHAVRFGAPVADHRRNSHNYLKDATSEWACIMVLEDLLVWLTTEARLEGSDYLEAYLSLSYALQEAVEAFKGKIWNDAARGCFHQMAFCMREWLKAFKTINGR